MSPRTEIEYEKLRLERKNQIMSAALELFATEGFHRSTISEIAEKAGISKGLIYNYFESKEELLRAIISKGIDLFVGSMDPNKDGVITDAEFEYLLETSFRILHENQQFFRLYMAVMSQPEALQLVKEKFEEFYLHFITLMAAYFRQRGIKDPETHAKLFAAIWDGVMLHYLIIKDFPFEKTKEMIIKQFKSGLL